MKNEKKWFQAKNYLRLIFIAVVLFCSMIYWPRFDLMLIIWIFAVVVLINIELDEALADQPQITGQNDHEVDDGFYYKQVLEVKNNRGSPMFSMMMWFFFINLPGKTESWALGDIGIAAAIFGVLLFRYFYLKYFDAVKDDTLTKHARKKSFHFLYVDEIVLKEVKGRKQWQIQLDQITAIDLGVFEVWIFYRDQGQIKQHSIHLLQWERLPELRQKLRAIKQRLQLAKA